MFNLQQLATMAQYVGRARDFLRTDIYYNLILYPLVSRKQRKLLAECRPNQSHTYTSFNRSPGQLEALIGPVLNFITQGAHSPGQTPLQINVMAGSIGAEAYTLASTLLTLRPDVDFHIHCSDLHERPLLVASPASTAPMRSWPANCPSAFFVTPLNGSTASIGLSRPSGNGSPSLRRTSSPTPSLSCIHPEILYFCRMSCFISIVARLIGLLIMH